jgi:biotin carboxyl carrier protein
MTIRKDYLVGGEPLRVTCDAAGGEQFTVRVGDRVHEVRAHKTPTGALAFSIGGRTFLASVAPIGSKGDTHVRIGGRTWRLKPHLGGRGGSGAAGGGGVLEAPMTGTVLAIHVKPGDAVEVGQTVAVVTAMKMEHKLTAGVAGTVAEVGAAAGDTVEQGHVVVRIEPSAGDA